MVSEMWDWLVQEEDLNVILEKYKQEVSIFGFTSTKYDMDLIKSEFTLIKYGNINKVYNVCMHKSF